MEVKPLTPLNSGIVLLVGVKASNFDEDIKNHPRVVMWSSQEQHWLNKEMPSNTRAVFMTRFIGHDAFKNIVAEARKRHITIFNPMGTGIIARQVKELLALPRPLFEIPVPKNIEKEVEHIITTPKETIVPNKGEQRAKLQPLYPFIDFNKNNIENAHILLKKANEMSINTTLGSLAQLVSKKRIDSVSKTVITPVKSEPLDVSVEILDNMIRGLQDMRAFLIATTNENNTLRAKLDNLKKAFGGL